MLSFAEQALRGRTFCGHYLRRLHVAGDRCTSLPTVHFHTTDASMG
jgi:hypothetical protein